MAIPFLVKGMILVKYDVVIVGAGPSGIFTALEMVRNNSKKKIAIIEKGISVEKQMSQNNNKKCQL